MVHKRARVLGCSAGETFPKTFPKRKGPLPSGPKSLSLIEAPVGIEPTNGGFAVLSVVSDLVHKLCGGLRLQHLRLTLHSIVFALVCDSFRLDLPKIFPSAYVILVDSHCLNIQ
jgi:hypothetical protein